MDPVVAGNEGMGPVYVIVILYMAGIMGVGLLFSRYARSTRDFFLAGQRFSWWLVSISAVASLVGSYSFIKYSEAAYKFGLSATVGYLNDWWWIPIWMFAWIPFIYYSRVTSIPEYFEKRFGPRTRAAATVVLLTYLLAYIGINLYTLGIALEALVGWNIYTGVFVTAVVVTIYVTWGGQASVIMTDLFQGIMLLVAGLAVCVLGIAYLGGFEALWSLIPRGHRFGLAPFNSPPEFNTVGVFWQDGISKSAAFWFMNQGILLRFMAAKSVHDARKGIVFAVLLLMPVAAIAVSMPGLIGKAMTAAGHLPADLNSKHVFVTVTALVASKPVFGLIMAALVAALMSTADTLINAVSAVFVTDVWKPYIRPGESDRHYLTAARGVSVAAAAIGVALVPLFRNFGTVYQAHGAVTASITPPMVVAILLGCTWKRFTPAAAFWTLTGGTAALFLSIVLPGVIAPFAQGVEMKGEGLKAFGYMRACFGISVSLLIAVSVTFFTKPRREADLTGLVWGTEREAALKFKGADTGSLAGYDPGAGCIKRIFEVYEYAGADGDGDRDGDGAVVLSPADLEAVSASPGDILFCSHRSPLFGGLRSFRATAASFPDVKTSPGWIGVPPAAMSDARFKPGQRIVVERIL